MKKQGSKWKLYILLGVILRGPITHQRWAEKCTFLRTFKSTQYYSNSNKTSQEALLNALWICSHGKPPREFHNLDMLYCKSGEGSRLSTVLFVCVCLYPPIQIFFFLFISSSQQNISLEFIRNSPRRFLRSHAHPLLKMKGCDWCFPVVSIANDKYIQLKGHPNVQLV